MPSRTEPLLATRERVAAACARAGRAPSSVTLVAVSKGQPVDAIRALHDAGQRDFGESRAQELAAKADALPADIRWHFLGALQRNKLPTIRKHATLVHSFDRPELAPEWKGPPVLLQVNVRREPQKGGVLPEDAPRALDALRAAGVRCEGLMTIPPAEGDPRPYFRELRALRDRLGLRELSMGMSADFEAAIEEGATFVRVGTALFGPRG